MRPELLSTSVYSIVLHYESEFRGIANSYRLASNLRRLHRLKWIMETSLTRTLARKLAARRAPALDRRHDRRLRGRILRGEKCGATGGRDDQTGVHRTHRFSR